MLTLVLVSTLAFGQKEVTKFLGIPVDGTKTEMRKKLVEKGFEISQYNNDILVGEFNGRDVYLILVTNNNKVWRIAVRDKNTCSEGQIKIRFNNLVHQFENNKRYFNKLDYTISDDEDIQYEMIFNDKQYQAVFYQRDLKAEEQYKSEFYASMGKETLDSLSQEEKEFAEKTLQSTTESALFEEMRQRTVWFTIMKENSEYYLTIFYENKYNEANGDDL